MAFTSSRQRYASFATVNSIPGEVIDAFWYIIDNHLKGVFTLEPVLNFELLDHHGDLSIRFSQNGNPTTMIIDFDYPYNRSWPHRFHAIDNMGRETIVTADEL